MCRTRLSFLIAALICTLPAVMSCDRETVGAIYEGDSGFAFASPVLYAEVSAEDGGFLEIPVYRGICGDASQAQISFRYDTSADKAEDPEWSDADPAGIFSLVTPKVTFAPGSCEAKARIRFSDYGKLTTRSKYRMKLEIADAVSPSQRSSVIVTVTKKLVFKKYGDCSYFDECIFENAYETEIYKADGEEIYRVMDPYHEGLVAEGYAAEGWLGETPDYVEFSCEGSHISFKQFATGMLFNKTHMAWAYYPSDYVWGRDFSKYDALNKKLDDRHFQLYAVYCLPSFQYGYMNDGIYKVDITVK